MIYGIGTDICDVRRIRASLERHGDRFAHKVLSATEFATWKARSARWPERGVRYLATRFSAKEAFSKAIGMGMRMPMTWRLCEIGKEASGKPVIVLHGVLKEWFEAEALQAYVSVTDETDYAGSFCVVERAEVQLPWRPEANPKIKAKVKAEAKAKAHTQTMPKAATPTKAEATTKATTKATATTPAKPRAAGARDLHERLAPQPSPKRLTNRPSKP